MREQEILALRSALTEVLTTGSWTQIERDHAAVGLGWRSDLDPGWGKGKYLEAVLRDLSTDELTALATRCRSRFPDRAPFRLQDALWRVEADGHVCLSEITRLTIADGLDGSRMHPREDPNTVLDRFATGSGPFGSPHRFAYSDDGALYFDDTDILGLVGGLYGVRGNTPPKWKPCGHRDVLDQYGFRSWPDQRVFLFLEHLTHPTVREGQEQVDWVARINTWIAPDGFGLVETERVSGRPVFKVRPTKSGVPGRPKNLIFASTGPKPELGFADAVNNDIVVLKNEANCLIYEDPISEGGLRWLDLVAWWSRKVGGDPLDEATRKGLGARLRAALGSEPERLFFNAYFQTMRNELGEALPALLPQVYLHYDPRTLTQLRARGEQRRFLVQRMDFLLLLPHSVRIVIEIDGRQHYSDGDGDAARPSPRQYANTVRSHRDLTLAGYEVYRFGGAELSAEAAARELVSAFFARLFRRHGLL